MRQNRGEEVASCRMRGSLGNDLRGRYVLVELETPEETHLPGLLVSVPVSKPDNERADRPRATSRSVRQSAREVASPIGERPAWPTYSCDQTMYIGSPRPMTVKPETTNTGRRPAGPSRQRRRVSTRRGKRSGKPQVKPKSTHS